MRRLRLDLQRLLLLLRTVVRLGIPLLSAAARRRPDGRQRLGVALRNALERLGLVYLKLGQYLATRHDLLPREVCVELEKAFDQVPGMRWEEVRRVLEQELGADFPERFSQFCEASVAAASIAQVHKARTRTGEWVAVKVQRAGINRLFSADIRNLRRFAVVVDWIGMAGTLSATEVVDEFDAYTRRELDFIVEGRTADRLRRDLTVHAEVPRVHWNLTTSKVLTLDFIDGPSLLEVERRRAAGDVNGLASMLPALELDRVLDNLTYASLHQLFVTGFFHGDPHPGNIIVLRDNRVAFLDFGIFGELNDYQRELLANYTASLAVGNIRGAYRYLAKIYFPTEASDERAFARDVYQTLGDWYHASNDPSAPAALRHVGGAFDAMLRVVHRHRYRATMGYLLFWRAIIVLDSVAVRLQPRFDLNVSVRHFFEQEGPNVLRRHLGWKGAMPALDVLSRPEMIPAALASIVDDPLRIETNTLGRSPGRVLAAPVSALLLLGWARVSPSTAVAAVAAYVIVMLALTMRRRID